MSTEETIALLVFGGLVIGITVITAYVVYHLD